MLTILLRPQVLVWVDDVLLFQGLGFLIIISQSAEIANWDHTHLLLPFIPSEEKLQWTGYETNTMRSAWQAKESNINFNKMICTSVWYFVKPFSMKVLVMIVTLLSSICLIKAKWLSLQVPVLPVLCVYQTGSCSSKKYLLGKLSLMLSRVEAVEFSQFPD